MLLCDAAQVSDGKLFILGGGWSMTGPDPVPSAVALKIDVDWHEAETSHHWELFLEDADGQPVLMETTEGTQPVEVRGEFTVSQPQGIPEGSPIDVALAVNLGPLPLAPGTRFAWRLMIDGESLPNASLGFTTRPPPPPADEGRPPTGRSAATSRTSFRGTSTGTGPARRSRNTTIISSA
jgi:hypothetical protein